MKTLFPAAAMLLAASAPAAFAAEPWLAIDVVASPKHERIYTVTIGIDDLDLNGPDSGVVLRSRVDRAAAQLCEAVRDRDVFYSGARPAVTAGDCRRRFSTNAAGPVADVLSRARSGAKVAALTLKAVGTR